MTTTKTTNISIATNITEVGEFFIVPNSASIINENGYAYIETLFWYKSIMEANGLIPESRNVSYETAKNMAKDDPLVQVWITTERNKDFISDLPAINDGFGISHFVRLSPYIPYSLIKDVKEGDTLTLNLPADVFVGDIPSGDYIAKYKTTIHFSLKAAQGKYRYRGFGPFEKTLDVVTHKYKEETQFRRPRTFGEC